MKFLKPGLNSSAPKRPSGLRSDKAPKPTSFGEKRALQMNQALGKAVQERKTLLQKEFASPDPLNKVYQQKGYRLDARIRKLKDETE